MGGGTYGTAPLAKLFFGSGGGSGGNDDVTTEHPNGGLGGAGGGILMIRAASIAVTGSVSARGNVGQGDAVPCFSMSTTECWDYSGPGGGGAGGSLLFSANQVDLGAALVSAEAGGGGQGGTSSGGAGGEGRIAVRYVTATTGTTTPASDLAVIP
jgi:hypothetical protein